jgi:autotransporter translocation and assembly factor TamB
MRKWLRIMGWTAAGLIILTVLGWAAMQTSLARTMLAEAMGDALSSPQTKVEVSGISGWLPSAPRISRITVADAEGIWLELDGITVDWHPLSLVWGAIDVDTLSISQIRWTRQPGGPARADSRETSLPALKLSLFQVKSIRVDAAVAGREARLSLDGHADLREPASRAAVALNLRQADGPARIHGDIDWNPGANMFRLAVKANDSAGGILPALAGLPPDAPLAVDLASTGTLDDWTSSLKASVGDAVRATGTARIRKDRQWHRLEAAIDARVDAIGPPSSQAWLKGDWNLALVAARSIEGALRLDSLNLKSPAAVVTARLEGEGNKAPLRLEAASSSLPIGNVTLELSAVPERAWSDTTGAFRFDGKVTRHEATAHFRGTLHPDALKLDVSLDPAGLEDVGIPQGRLALEASLGLARASGAFSATGRGKIDQLVLGDAMADGLMGGRMDISFAVNGDAAGALKTASLSLTAARASIDAKLSGTLETPELSATGQIAGKPVTIAATMTRNDSGEAVIRNATISVGRVNLAGDLRHSGAGLSGTLRLEATNLADISPFVDADLEGPASGTIVLPGKAANVLARIELASPRARVDTIWFDAIRLVGRIRNPSGALGLDLEATATRADADGFVVEDLAATGKGALSALDVTMTGLHKAGQLRAAGRLKVDRSPTRISLEAMTLQRDGRELRLAAPATLTVDGGRVDIPSVRIDAGNGSVRIDGKAGREMALLVEPRALPLWAIGLLAEPLPVAGNLSGRIMLKGRARDRLSDFDLMLTSLAPGDEQATALRDLTLAARGTTDRGGATLRAQLARPRGARLDISGKVPFSDAAALALDLNGQVDLAVANAWLGATGERAAGRLTLSGRVSGSLSSPAVNGTGRLAGGSFRSAAAGFELRDIEASLEGSERRILLSRLTGTTPNGGTVEADGTLTLDRTTGYPVSFTARAKDARLVSTSLTTLTADVNARMTGALLGAPLISGDVSISRWDIRVPERLSRPLTPIKVTHRNAPAGLVTDDDEGGAPSGSALPFRLDVAVRAPREVFVRGQGIDAEFGGEARLAGSLDEPAVRGRFDLRRGAVTLLSQRVVLSRGSVQFVGDTEPMLDIAGSVSKNGVAATVSVKGRAGDPQIALSSVPSLPQDEILSRLLFSKRTTQLSPFEAAQLAQVIGRWSGLDTGPDLLERLRTVIGIDALTATTDETGTTSVAAGSYLGRGVYVGVSEAAGGSATVDVDLSDHIKLRGEAGATGTKIGVAAEWEY